MGGPERPGTHQPSTFSNNIKITNFVVIMRCASAKREPFSLGFPRKKSLMSDRIRG